MLGLYLKFSLKCQYANKCWILNAGNARLSKLFFISSLSIFLRLISTSRRMAECKRAHSCTQREFYKAVSMLRRWLQNWRHHRNGGSRLRWLLDGPRGNGAHCRFSDCLVSCADCDKESAAGGWMGRCELWEHAYWGAGVNTAPLCDCINTIFQESKSD